MAKIAAIPTTYNGVTFRSRLEARWAVFFDTLNIKWQYEPQKLVLVNGVRYIPDFLLSVDNWIDNSHIWIEVKPSLGFVQEYKSHFAEKTLVEKYQQNAQTIRDAGWRHKYYIGTAEFRLFRIYKDHDPELIPGIRGHEVTFRITKMGKRGIEKDIPQYGKWLDISHAIRIARSAKFD